MNEKCLRCSKCWPDVKYCTKFELLLFSPKFKIDIDKEKCFIRKEIEHE